MSSNMQKLLTLFPFLDWKSRVTKLTLRKDVLAGLIGAIIVLPQGVAFATIAGLPPEYGLYSAIVPAIIAALFGSSWHLVSGPTTAISLVVFATLSPLAAVGSPDYVALAITLSLFVGAIQLLMGWMKLGSLVNFISHTVVIGFTAGAGILIASNQVKNFTGLAVPQGSSFSETWTFFFRHLGAINGYVLLVALATRLDHVHTCTRPPPPPTQPPRHRHSRTRRQRRTQAGTGGLRGGHSRTEPDTGGHRRASHQPL